MTESKVGALLDKVPAPSDEPKPVLQWGPLLEAAGKALERKILRGSRYQKRTHIQA